METRLAPFIRDTAEGKEADAILRQCVHCGFCNATCPTYQLLGDELDGPRGRIYLIKQLLEGAEASRTTQLHLDRCLTCRACEPTCPSGVQYGRLLDIGRRVADQRIGRPLTQTLARKALGETLASTTVFSATLSFGRVLRPLLPATLAARIPAMEQPEQSSISPAAKTENKRRMLLLGGCVQPALRRSINVAAQRVLSRLGIDAIEAIEAGCCGALRFHLGDQDGGLDDMRRTIDAWWPHLEAGVEAIVMTASGCGVTVKEYAHYLRHDRRYAAKADKVSALTCDISEVMTANYEKLEALLPQNAAGPSIAFHSPCTLQHGQRIRGGIEQLLERAGFCLTATSDPHLCCGSAGTYSILQPEIAAALRDNKLRALTAAEPRAIATANIGCLSHLQSGTDIPVVHWIELIENALQQQEQAAGAG